MLMIAGNFHSQLTRLDIAPSVKDWNSIARFFQKSEILDKIDKTAKLANERAENTSANSKP